MPQLLVTLVATLVLVAGLANAAAPPKKAHGTAKASARIMKELVEFYKSDLYKTGKVRMELVGDNLYEWQVKLFIVDPADPLRADLQRLKATGEGEDHIMMRISFGDKYPFAPPFVRIVYPVLEGRYSYRNGSICNQILSKQGWIPGCNIESLILILVDHMKNGGTRVKFGSKSEECREDYTEEKAREATEKNIKAHGWD